MERCEEIGDFDEDCQTLHARSACRATLSAACQAGRPRLTKGAMDFVLLFGAALLAGIMNAVAGGGSFITFPALVFTGVPSIVANASSTVALSPGSFASAWGYRQIFPTLPGIGIWPMVVLSLIGGVVGALLLLLTPQHTFDAIIPWL